MGDVHTRARIWVLCIVRVLFGCCLLGSGVHSHLGVAANQEAAVLVVVALAGRRAPARAGAAELKTGIHATGQQAPISFRYAWEISRVRHTVWGRGVGCYGWLLWEISRVRHTSRVAWRGAELLRKCGKW